MTLLIVIGLTVSSLPVFISTDIWEGAIDMNRKAFDPELFLISNTSKKKGHLLIFSRYDENSIYIHPHKYEFGIVHIGICILYQENNDKVWITRFCSRIR